MAFFIFIFSLLFFSQNSFAQKEDSRIKHYSISFDAEFFGTNYDDYNSSKIFQSSTGRQNIINYQGGGQYLAGFSSRIDFDKDEKYWIYLAYRSTLLTGDENDSQANLTDQEFLNKDDSSIFEFYYRINRLVGDFKYYSLSNGKIKYSDTSGDTRGNEGVEVGNYQLLIKRYQIANHYKFKNFPFYMGLRYMNTRLPRIPYTYEIKSYRGAGELQIIKYESLLVSMELGESEFVPISKVGGFKWSMGFAMGLGEYEFQNHNLELVNESSSMFHVKLAWGYQFNFTNYFLRFDNSAHILSLDNNDNSISAATNTAYRTGGADEEFRALIKFGKSLL